MARFAQLMRPVIGTTIVDIGGGARTWTDLATAPHVTIVNTDLQEAAPDGENVRFAEADARSLPFEDSSFDIAFSNSVIEHVGSFADQGRMAREMRRVAPAYYLQTPARSFPIEPHYLTPFVHWLPRRLRRRILRNFTVWGLITRPSQEYVDFSVSTTRLLDRAELEHLFPDATLIPEKWLGLTKSWVVVRRTASPERTDGVVG